MSKKNEQNPRKEPTQQRSKDTVEVILTAATHILGSLGFDSATTNRIAEKAGISIGSIYQYFPNKEALAGALIDRYVNKHSEKFARMLTDLSDRPVQEIVQKTAEEVVSMYLGNRKFLKIIGELVGKIERIPSVMEARRRTVQVLATEFRRRSSELHLRDPELAAFMIVNGGMGVIQTVLYDDKLEMDVERLSSEITKMSWGYLKEASA